MADSKKYDGSQWEHSLRKLTTATEAVENPLYSDGTAITSYTIKGNTVQNGTPSPQNPVMPQGVGNKTANLFNLKEWAASITSVRGNGTLDVTGDVISVTSNELQDAYTSPYSNVTGVYKIPVNPSTQYRLQGSMSSNGNFIIFQNGTTATWTTFGAITTAADTTFLTIRFGVKSTEPLGSTATFENFMISEGASLKDYEPYGYKIPISNGQQTTNIYLGSMQTVRQIKKYVLTGNETVRTYDTTYERIFVEIPNFVTFGNRATPIISTHYQGIYDERPIGNVPMNSVYSGSVGDYGVYIKEDGYTSSTDFKAYLAAQYAAGTPVTIWYAISNSETGIVNEPLMKIGTYADTLSNATAIPTTEGANSITVDTTVQPSEFTATWTGWHDSSVKEYDGTNWQ